MTLNPRMDFDMQFDAVVTAVWEIWTKNGLGLDDDDRAETGKSVRDAVTNAYTDGVSLADWQARALATLDGGE
jgi:hypothetical protein